MLDRFFKPILLALTFALTASAQGQTILQSLRDELAVSPNSTDSLRVLFNIYDCSPLNLQGDVLEELYTAAQRAGDDREMAYILKMAANHYSSNDSMLQVLSRRAKMLPDGDDKLSTMLFMNVRKTAKQIRTLPEAEREANLRKYLSQYSSSKSMNIYQRIEYLFYLCAYLRSTTEGELLTKYFQELQDLIDQLPARDISLKSLFYTQAALSYLTNEMYDEAINANKTLLDIIAELERQHIAKGRIYRNYNRSIYICCRRLLTCYKGLTPEEVETYYQRIMSLLDTDPSLRRDWEKRQRPTIYYLMAKKRYDEAIPLIKHQLKDESNTHTEQQMLADALIEASRATGNTADELYALQLNNELMKQRIEAKSAETYKEMQIIYEVNDLKQENSSLMLANQQIISDRHHEHMTFAIIGVIILANLLIIVFVLYRRATTLTESIRESNEMILGERDALKKTQKELIEARDKARTADRIKTDFVNNMSHQIRTPLAAIVEYSNLISDCAYDDKREYIKRFADIVSLNTDLLLTLVNDVLDLPSIENAKLSVQIKSASVKEICNMAIANVSKHIAPGVSLIFAKENADDIRIDTDPNRVEQVLLNLLLNAAKFTEKGTIVLDYNLSDDGSKLTFNVTDTGIGIPRGKEEIIFSRFEKLNSETQGNGLGLYIGRLLAELLKGDLSLDADYRAGARFIFSVPTKG